MFGNMKFEFKKVGIDYHDCPIDVREKFAFDSTGATNFLVKLKEVTSAEDILLISTCNRTEIYFSGDSSCEIVEKTLFAEKGVGYDNYKRYIVSIEETKKTVEYLFRVALGLEAQVIGDLQIGSQVKNAYQRSADLNLAGPFLHRLMHTIFYANKRSVQETTFRDGAASVSYAATELVEDLMSEVKDPRVLLSGVGDIGKNLCKNLSDSSRLSVTVTNRTKSRAEKLADEHGFRYIDISRLSEAIEQSDVVITSVSSKTPLITKSLLEAQKLLTFKYFIDLSVPRSVNPDVEEIPGVIVYNIDQIRDKVNEAQQRRLEAIPKVEAIIEDSMASMASWAKEMEVSPTIRKLKSALESIRKEEIARYIKDLDENEVEKVDLITQGIMQKILKLPVIQLKAACKRGQADELIEVLHDLFDLEKEKAQ